MNEITDERMINEFVSESRDHLATIEPDLMALEQEGAQVSDEVVNRVFRAMHSIKGASGFFGFDALTQLSHVMENVLMKFRDKKMLPDPEIIDALLAGADKIGKMIEDIDSGNDVTFDQQLASIKAVLEDKSEPSRPKDDKAGETESISDWKSHVVVESFPDDLFKVIVKGPATLKEAVFEFNQERLQTARATGCYHLYAIWIHFKQDLIEKERTPQQFLARLDKLGRCFYDDFNTTAEESGNTLKEDSVYHVFLGTVLESDLIGYALSIPEQQIRVFDKDDLDPAQAIKKDPVVVIKKSEPQPKPAPAPQAPSKRMAGSPETIRVSVDLIDRLMNYAGELVLGRNQLRQELEILAYKNPKLGIVIQNVDSVTSEIQQDIMQMRLQPVGNLLNKLARVVRDLSRQLSKEGVLFIEGKEVELDKTILEGLSDPLTHLIRNCLDHGIEMPDERKKAGKPPSGTIHVSAFHEGGQVNIVVTDDGRGIDPDELVQKAVKKGIVDAGRAKRMTEAEKINLVLLPGLSTAEKITDISGRGVGMDVVKTNIEKLGGNLEIESTAGKGTTVQIRLPLTLAIIPSLIVGVAELHFAIPQVSVKELVCIRAGEASDRIEAIGDAVVLRLRESLLPLVRMADILGLERTFVHPENGKQIPEQRERLADRRQHRPDSDSGTPSSAPQHPHQRFNGADRRQNRHGDINVAVLRVGTNLFGLIVDDLFNNEEIVVKPLSKHVKESKCFAGATIMGDGRVAMIVDATGIAEFSQLRFAEINAEECRRYKEETRRSKTVIGRQPSVLIFNNAYNEHFALPLDSISRLEKIYSKDVHKMGTRMYMNYRGNGLPLIYLEDILPVCAFPNDIEEFFVIIPKTNDLHAGIVVSRIFDTVEANVAIQKDNGTHPGILGSAFMLEHLIQFIDPAGMLQLISEELGVTEKPNESGQDVY